MRNLCAFANVRLSQLLCDLILATVAAEFAFLGYYEGRSRGSESTLALVRQNIVEALYNNAGLMEWTMEFKKTKSFIVAISDSAVELFACLPVCNQLCLKLVLACIHATSSML